MSAEAAVTEYDPRKDPKYGCTCWLADELEWPHEHVGWAIQRWDFGSDMPYEDVTAAPLAEGTEEPR